MPNDLLPIVAAARKFHININTLRGWVYRRDIPEYRLKVGQRSATHPQVSESELAAFLEERKRLGGAE